MEFSKILKWLYPITFIVLFALNIYLLNALNLKSEKIGILENEIKSIIHHKTKLENSLINHWRIENSQSFSPLVLNETGDTINLLNNSSNKLIFRFYESNCIECIQSFIEQLVLFSEQNNVELELVCDYRNLNNLKLLKIRTGYSDQIYRSNRILDYETMDPFLFLTNKSGSVKNVFLPDEDEPKLLAVFLRNTFRVGKE